MNRMSGKMKEMQTEINYLKKKQKNQIATILNNQTDLPSMHILNWIKSIPVSQSHLEMVFRKSLEDGIQQVMIDGLSTGKTLGSNMPVRAYTEKKKCIFVYIQKDESSKWIICDNTVFRTLCVCIASRFIELFILWQTSQIDSDFQTQEQNMHFMKKVMDTTYSQQGHVSKMIEQVYTNIHTDMTLIQEYDD
jgi:hypothetical protein